MWDRYRDKAFMHPLARYVPRAAVGATFTDLNHVAWESELVSIDFDPATAAGMCVSPSCNP